MKKLITYAIIINVIAIIVIIAVSSRNAKSNQTSTATATTAATITATAASTSTPTPTPSPTPTPTPSPTWETVITFDGKSDKSTEKFTISSKEWRVRWSTTGNKYSNGEYGVTYANLYQLVNGEPRSYSSIFNANASDSDVSYFYKSGIFYIDINTSQQYSITVEQKK